ncbi:MAG: selenium metabolism-associated LysR family transcriptional regulator [Clostridia bacterium]|nr:selenium metabolism-associated LysR family transcriptional regulator [Clostridia bacterium]
MNFNHLKVFLVVAKNLSYSRAAEELFISQPTVSIQVKKLEEELGIDLFEQLGKKIYLTEAGKLLYSYVNRIFSLAVEAELAVQELKGLCSGQLVIGASTTPGIYLLPEIIGSFQELYPGLGISLEISNTHKVQEQLLLNQLDLGVVGEELMLDPQLQIEPLIEDELVVIVAAGHPLAERQSITLEELFQQRLILRERGSSTREVLEEKVRHQGNKLKVAMQLSSVEAIKQAVAANLGVSIVSKLSVGLELGAGVLSILSFSDVQLVRQINLAYHKDKKISPAVREFMRYLSRYDSNNRSLGKNYVQ